MKYVQKFAAVWILLSFTQIAMGQGKEPVSAGYLHKFKGGLDRGSEVSMDRFSLNAGLPIYRENDSFVAISANYSVSDYSFEGAFNPWGKIEKYGLGVPVHLAIGENWKWASVWRVGSEYESGANKSESYTYGVISSLNYKFSESLTVGPGISYFSQLEDSASIFPIVSIRWKINDQLRLSTGPSEGANEGANIYLRQKLGNQWDLIAGLYYQNNRFRLSEKSNSAVDGVGEESTLALYGVAKFYPSDQFSLSVISGISFGNEYNLFDIRGDEIEKQDADAAPFMGFRVNYEF